MSYKSCILTNLQKDNYKIYCCHAKDIQKNVLNDT